MNLFEHFSAYTKLPVSLEDVAAFVLERSRFASIKVFPRRFNEEALRGFCWQFIDKPHNSINHHRHAWILYSETLPPEMARMVVCKEMLHLLDPPQEQARARTQVDQLIEEIVQPFEIKAARQTHSDNGGMVMAAAILIPAGAIEELRPKVDDGSLGYDTLSKLAGVPEYWVRAAFSPQWQEVLQALDQHYDAREKAAIEAIRREQDASDSRNTPEGDNDNSQKA